MQKDFSREDNHCNYPFQHNFLSFEVFMFRFSSEQIWLQINIFLFGYITENVLYYIMWHPSHVQWLKNQVNVPIHTKNSNSKLYNYIIINVINPKFNGSYISFNLSSVNILELNITMNLKLTSLIYQINSKRTKGFSLLKMIQLFVLPRKALHE